MIKVLSIYLLMALFTMSYYAGTVDNGDTIGEDIDPTIMLDTLADKCMEDWNEDENPDWETYLDKCLND